jgi:hypothetical protein
MILDHRPRHDFFAEQSFGSETEKKDCVLEAMFGGLRTPASVKDPHSAVCIGTCL